MRTRIALGVVGAVLAAFLGFVGYVRYGLTVEAGIAGNTAPVAPAGQRPFEILTDANFRRSPLAGKRLDMRCRVAGCTNRSGGPRRGFICESHRKTLSKKEQQAARDAWRSEQST